MIFKEEIYHCCLTIINDRINLLQNSLKDLRESAANETKSTAGDKHETALAMLQIEQENTGRQLKEALQQQLQLSRIQIQANSSKILNGSVIKTNHCYFFISCAIGKIAYKEIKLFAISPQSPIGIKLLGLQVKDKIEMNKIIYTIEEIF